MNDTQLCRPSNLCRPPAWRWLGASGVPTAPPFPGWADEYVYAAAAIRAVTRTNVRAVDTFGPAGTAFHLYEAAVTAAGSSKLGGTMLVAAELDGTLLAGKEPAEAAAAVGLPVAVVEWYERLFFDVRGRLANSGWVAAVVIGQLHGGSVETLVPALARAYGFYTGDTSLVRTFLRGLDEGEVKAAAGEGAAAAIYSDMRTALAVKANLAVRTVQPDQRAFRSILEMHAKQLEAARNKGEADGSEVKYRQAARELLGGADWQYQAPPEEYPEGPQLAIES